MTVTPDVRQRETSQVDFIDVNRLLSDEEREVRDRVRAFADEKVVPTAAEHWDKAQFSFDLLPSLGELGIAGGSFEKEYGCSGWNNVAYWPRDS